MQSQDDIVAPEPDTAIGQVDISRGIDWIVEGFNLFMKKPGEWVIAGLGLFVIDFLLSYIPMIGNALATICALVAVGALLRACRALDEQQDPIAAARQAAAITPLWILGLIAAGLVLATALLVELVLMVLYTVFLIDPDFRSMFSIPSILPMLLTVPLIMALWMAPGLVVLKGTHPVEAVRLSLVAAMKNLSPFLVFYVVSAIACFLGALVMGVGLIVVYPLLICAAYIAYKDIFGAQGSGAAVVPVEQAPPG